MMKRQRKWWCFNCQRKHSIRVQWQTKYHPIYGFVHCCLPSFYIDDGWQPPKTIKQMREAKHAENQDSEAA